MDDEIGIDHLTFSEKANKPIPRIQNYSFNYNFYKEQCVGGDGFSPAGGSAVAAVVKLCEAARQHQERLVYSLCGRHHTCPVKDDQ